MTRFRAKGHGAAVVLFFMLPGLLTTQVSHSTPPAAPPPLGAKFDTKLPVEFNMDSTKNLATILTSCSGNSLTAFFDTFTKKKDKKKGMVLGPITVKNPCDAYPPAVAGQELQCEAFLVSGVFSLDKLKAIKIDNEGASAGLQCKRSRIEALKGELMCLSKQAEMLSQQVGNLQNAYVTNMQRMQQDVAQMKEYQATVEAQGKEAIKRLKGDEATGQKGIEQLEIETAQMLQEFEGKIVEFQAEQEGNVALRGQFIEAMEEETMAEATSCFKTEKQAKFARAGEGTATAYDYILNQYELAFKTDPDGRVDEKNEIRAKDAAAARAGLAGLLDDILNQSPDKQSAPTSEQELQAAQARRGNDAMTIFSIADVEKQFGNRLRKYTGAKTATNKLAVGQPIYDAVMKHLGKCFSKAEKAVKIKRKRKGQALYGQETRVNQSERATAAKINTQLGVYSRQYSANLKGLTGMNLPLNLSACDNAPPFAQLNCVKQLKTNMQGIYDGTSANSAMAITIKGGKPKYNLAITCQGLKGCSSALNNVANNARTEQARVQSEKLDYITKANQNTVAFTKRLADMLSPQSAQVANRLKELNLIMGGMGVNPGVSIDLVQNETLEPDESMDGLYRVPKNPLDLIGGMMTPKLLDVGRNNFEGSNAGISQQTEKLEEQMQKVKEREFMIAGLEKTCPLKTKNETIAKVTAAMQTKIDAMMAANCGMIENSCDQDGFLTGLIKTVSELEDKFGEPAMAALDSAQVNDLNGSVMAICSSAIPKPGQMAGGTTPGTDSGQASGGYGSAGMSLELQDWWAQRRKAQPPACQSLANRTKGDVAKIKSILSAGGRADDAR